jgi:hypothetical protein
MATTTTVEITDDLDGSKGASTVTYSFEGVTYTIDLSDKHRAEMAKALAKYIERSQRVRGAIVHAHKRASSKTAREFDLVQLRSWAAVNGVALPARGRIPQAIVAQYVQWRDTPRAG